MILEFSTNIEGSLELRDFLAAHRTRRCLVTAVIFDGRSKAFDTVDTEAVRAICVNGRGIIDGLEANRTVATENGRCNYRNSVQAVTLCVCIS